MNISSILRCVLARAAPDESWANKRQLRDVATENVALLERHSSMSVTAGALTIILLVLGASACDKQPNGPTSADRARCAHIDREAELGNAFYDICLNNPWPTELPPATQEGLSTFGGIINDTLLFVAGSPRSFPDETAKAKLTYLRDGTINLNRFLFAGFGTWQAIDSSQLIVELLLDPSGDIVPYRTATQSNFAIRHHHPSINGTYYIDTLRTMIALSRWDDLVVAGTIDAWFIDPNDTTRQLHLSDGRFDLTVQP